MSSFFFKKWRIVEQAGLRFSLNCHRVMSSNRHPTTTVRQQVETNARLKL